MQIYNIRTVIFTGNICIYHKLYSIRIIFVNTKYLNIKVNIINCTVKFLQIEKIFTSYTQFLFLFKMEKRKFKLGLA